MRQYTVKFLLVSLFLVHLSVHFAAGAHFHNTDSILSSHASFALHDLDHCHDQQDLVPSGLPAVLFVFANPAIEPLQPVFLSPPTLDSQRTLSPPSSRAPPIA